jgi:hypothetical protein
MRQRFSISNYRAKDSSSGASPNAFFQPKLSINQPNDVYEQQADAVAENVMSMPEASSKKAFFTPSSIPSIQKQDDNKTTETKTDDKKPEDTKAEAKVAFINTESLKKAIKDIFEKLPDRYKDAYKAYEKTHETYIFDLSESRKLASKEIMALWNLSNALVYKSYTGYKNVGFADSVKIAESLSGVADTYISIASLLLHKDLDKYITNEVPDLIKQNLGVVLLAGLLIQGGITAVQYATSSEKNFTSLLNPVLTSFTTPPVGFTNPLVLDNIADPRWKSPFGKPSPGLDITDTKNSTDPTTSPALNVNLGVNIASALSLYPKSDEDKKKYKGFEAYPFFNFTRAYAEATDKGPEQQDKYLVGIFIGDKGVYTIMEAGLIKGPLGIIETYGKGGLVLKNFGHLKLLSLDAEADQREPSNATRARINAASQIEIVDNNRWQFILGGTLGGLLPGDGKQGGLDYGASASLYYKNYSADRKDIYKTGGEIAFTSRSQDPFDETSKRLFTLKAGLVLKGIVHLGIQYDQISGGGPVNTFPTVTPDLTLPENNVTGYVGVDIAPLLFRDEKRR